VYNRSLMTLRICERSVKIAYCLQMKSIKSEFV
jgi:hypothetical protein